MKVAKNGFTPCSLVSLQRLTKRRRSTDAIALRYTRVLMIAPHQRHALIGLASGLIGALLAGALGTSGVLKNWEAKTWDMRVTRASTQASTQPAHDAIRIIYLDQHSLNWARDSMGINWPWYRETYATLLNFLNRTQPKAIAFDWIFDAPSPYQMADDEAFVQAIARTPNFVGTVFSSPGDRGLDSWPNTAKARTLRRQPLEWSQSVGAQKGEQQRITSSIPGVRDAAAGLGDVRHHIYEDTDYVVRRVSPFTYFDGRLIPALGIAPLLLGTNEPTARFDGNALVINDRMIPMDQNGQAILRFRDHRSVYKPVSAAAIIQSELALSGIIDNEPLLSPSDYKDKYVFFAPKAPSLGDTKPFPDGTVSPGVIAHATLLDNVLSQDLARDTSPGFNVFYTGIVAILAGVLSVLARRLWQSLLLFSTCIIAPYGLGTIAYSMSWWLPVVSLPSRKGALLIGWG